MKKIQVKRSLQYTKPKDLLKPFGFCCDIGHQDPETRYNMRIPPFVNSLTNIAPKSEEGPDLKFRLQDIGKPTSPAMKVRSFKIKSSMRLGRGKRGKGPLRWYIEDEIALARDIIASEREAQCKREKEMKRQALRAKKNKKHKKPAAIKTEKSHDKLTEDNDSEKDAEKVEAT